MLPSFPVPWLGTETNHLLERALFHKLTLLEAESCYLISARMKCYGSIVFKAQTGFFLSALWLIPLPEGLFLA